VNLRIARRERRPYPTTGHDTECPLPVKEVDHTRRSSARHRDAHHGSSVRYDVPDAVSRARLDRIIIRSRTSHLIVMVTWAGMTPEAFA
jgi:hypothetical protein